MRLDLDKSAWKCVTFGDVVKNLNVTVRDTTAAGIDRIIAMEHLDPGELKISRWGSPEDGTTFTRRVRPGQTIFGKRRAYQRKAAYVEFDAICSGDILVFEADPTLLLPELLPFIVQSNSFYHHALGTSAGSLSPRTNWRDLATFEFDLPPLDEQQRIADLFWAIEQHKQQVLAGHASAAVPIALWVDAGMRALLTEGRPLADGVRTSAYGPRFSNALYSEIGKYRLLRTTDMDSVGNIDYDTMPRAELDSSYDPHVLQNGDVLISRSGTCGIPAVFDGTIGGNMVIPGAFLIRLRLNERLDPHFLRAFFNSGPGRELTAALAQGGVQKNIRGSSLLQAEVPMPPIATQRLFLRDFEVVEESLRILDREIGALGALRTGLLVEIFGDGE